MQKSTIIIVLLIALVSLSVGYLIGARPSAPIAKKTDGGYESGYKAGWEAAKKRLEEAGLGGPIGNIEIKNLRGEIKEIKDNTLVIKTQPIGLLSDPELNTRNVEFDDSTVIFLQAQKDPAVFLKEMEEFNKNPQPEITSTSTPENNPIPPSPQPFERKNSSAADFKVGQFIDISSDKDIKDDKNFKAKEIIINIQSPATEQSMPTL